MSTSDAAGLRPLLQARLARTLDALRRELPPDLPFWKPLADFLGADDESGDWEDLAHAARHGCGTALDRLEAAGEQIIAATMAELDRWAELIPAAARLPVLRRVLEPGPDGRPPAPWSTAPPWGLLLSVLLVRYTPPWEAPDHRVAAATTPPEWIAMLKRWTGERLPGPRCPERLRPVKRYPPRWEPVPPDFQAFAFALAFCLAEREERPEIRAWETAAAAGATQAGEVRPVHLALAELVCQGAGGDARGALARALADELRRSRAELGMDELPPAGPEACREMDGKLWLDERAACFLERQGPHGSEQARELRTKAAARWSAAFAPLLPGVERPPADALWRLWLPCPDAAGASRFALALARALGARMQAELEAERQRAAREQDNRTKLVCPAATFAARRRFSELGRTPPGQLALPGEPGQAWFIAPGVAGDLLRSVRRGLAEVDGVAGDLLLRFLVCEVWDRFVAEEQDPRLLVAAGLVDLAAKIGISGSGRSPSTLLRNLLDALQNAQARWPGGEVHGLLTWGLERFAPGHGSHCWVNVDPVLAPQAWKRIDDPDMRRLIPVLRQPPPLAAVNRKLHPAALALSWTIMEAFATNVRQLRDGGVNLDWRRMAADVGFPASSLGTLRESWIGPFLEEQRGRFTLANPDARRMLTQAADGRDKAQAKAIARRRSTARPRPR